MTGWNLEAQKGAGRVQDELKCPRLVNFSVLELFERYGYVRTRPRNLTQFLT